MEFEVFENGDVRSDFALHGAYLFGTDGIAIRRAQISFGHGIIACKKTNLETAGLALLWLVEGFGRVLLSTTCLPERPAPYNLNLELARGKLMNVLNKREDWSYFDSLPGLDELFKEARDLLISAIESIWDPATASKLADQSLQKSLVLSEKLAMKQAESLFETRGRTRTFGRSCLGCRADPAMINNSAYFEKLTEVFGSVTVPVNWAQIEPTRGSYDFSTVDMCMSAISKKRLAICAGPLLCFSRQFLPDWLVTGALGFEKIREAAYQFVTKMVSRYYGAVHAWRVVSGLNVVNHFGFSFEQILEMTRAATMAARRGSDRAVKIVEIINPWGEYYATTPYTIPPLVYVDMVAQSGISFDAFGVRMQFGKDQPGLHIRDMMQVSAVLDYFGAVAKPLYVTEVEVPSRDDSSLQPPEAAGVGHDQWSEARQGQWIEQFYKIALSKPFVETVAYSNLADTKDSTVANSGLLTEKLEPKKSFLVLKKLQRSILAR